MKSKFTAILLSIAALFELIVVPLAGRAVAAEPDFTNDYVLLDWCPVKSVYWNSQDPALAAQLITKENKPGASNLTSFVSSGKMFTKEEIPVGSIIEIESGYQYRPEAWKTLSVQDIRPANVSTPRITVDEAWWGDYTYRAFNVSLKTSGAINNSAEEIRNCLRIYIPKTSSDSTPPPAATTPAATTPPPASTTPAVSGKSLKILAVGNSFSEDALAHLYDIATKSGYEEVILGNLFIGACTLETHKKNAEGDIKAYTFQKNVKGVWTNYSRSLSSGIQDEAWDYITLQQGSGSSGLANTYGDLEFVTDYIKNNKTNPNAKIGWHMTWAYQQDSTHNEFGKYNRDQLTMYHGIINAVEQRVLSDPNIEFVIPAGTAIQNMRTSYVGDTLTRDGYHMSKNLGRYILSLTWFKTITGQSIDDISWVPSRSEIPEAYGPVIKEAVNNAYAAPYKITQSSYPPESVPTPNPETDYSQYDLLDLEAVANAYWNPTHNTYYRELITKEKDPSKTNFNLFIASGRMFTKKDIPIGSFIEVDPGYQYRPDGWTSLTQQTAPRPLEVETAKVYVDTAWWGEYQYRTFNISTANPKQDISQETEKVKNSVRIYVPKNAYSVETQITDGTANTTFTKLSESEGTDIFLLAIYHNGRMVKLTQTEEEVPLYGQITHTIQGVEQGYTVKAFVLDSFETMKPLSIQSNR